MWSCFLFFGEKSMRAMQTEPIADISHSLLLAALPIAFAACCLTSGRVGVSSPSSGAFPPFLSTKQISLC